MLKLMCIAYGKMFMNIHDYPFINVILPIIHAYVGL